MPWGLGKGTNPATGNTSVGRGEGDTGTQPQGSPSAVGSREGGKPSHRDTPRRGRDAGTQGDSPRDDPELWGPGRGGGEPSHARLSCGTRVGGHSGAPVGLGTKRDSPACVAWGQQGARVPRGHTDPCIAPSPPSASAQGWGRRRCSPSPSTPPGRCTSPRCCKPVRGDGVTPRP